MRSGPGAARTILLSHIISARPSKQPRMVRTFLKVYMELDSYFLFLQEQIKDTTTQLGAGRKKKKGQVLVPQAAPQQERVGSSVLRGPRRRLAKGSRGLDCGRQTASTSTPTNGALTTLPQPVTTPVVFTAFAPVVMTDLMLLASGDETSLVSTVIPESPAMSHAGEAAHQEGQLKPDTPRWPALLLHVAPPRHRGGATRLP